MTKRKKADIRDEWYSLYGFMEKNFLSKGSLFHYTTRDNLWNIIESNSFYARHIRFSNDSAEYYIGKKEVETIGNEGKELTDLNDCYMVCFCKKDDILSQWREYARGGVSFELNFTEDMFYTIMCNEKTKNENEKNKNIHAMSMYYIPLRFHFRPVQYKVVYSVPTSVIYLSKNAGQLGQGRKAGVKKIKEIVEIINERAETMEKERMLKNILPFIKHVGFKEEREYRLLFSGIDDISPYVVDYLTDRGRKIPYIRVQFGNAEKGEEMKCTIKYYKVGTQLINQCKTHLKNGRLEIPDKQESIEITLEEEKCKRANKDAGHIYIENCKYQKYIFEMIDYYVTNYNKTYSRNVKVWCGGHLPIRGITIGPSEDAQELRESVSQKIKSTYWLKYATVKLSDIPYRARV